MTLHLGEDNAERKTPVSPVLAQPQPCKTLLAAVKNASFGHPRTAPAALAMA